MSFLGLYVSETDFMKDIDSNYKKYKINNQETKMEGKKY